MKKIFHGHSKNTTASDQQNIENTYNLAGMAARLMRGELIRLLCFTLIPVLLFSCIVFLIIGHYITAKTESEDRSRLEFVQAQMDFIVTELDALNLTFSVNTEITSTFIRAFALNDARALSALSEICKHYLIPTVAAHEYIHSIYVYTPNMQKIFLSSAVGPVSLSEAEDIAWLDAYQQMRKNNKTYYAQSRRFKNFAFEENPQEIITLYRQLYLGEGVIVLNLYCDAFDDMLRGHNSASTQQLLAVNENYEILMQNRSEVALTVDTLQALCSAPESELSAYQINDTDYFVTRLPSGNRYNWTYLSLTPRDDMVAVTSSMLALLVMILLPTLVLCVAFAWKHAKTLRNNALRIVHTLDAVERHATDLCLDKHTREDFYGMVTQRILGNYAERSRMRYLLEQKQREMRDLELSALHAQINPHFLFNTLKSAYWMSVSLTKGPNEVSKMIENMTDILQYSLDSSDDLATLKAEIHNTKAYIAIQHVRYGNRFTVQWDYDPQLEKYYTVKLLFQPLIENSIMHGMRWRENRQLHIRITLLKAEDYIEVTVSDDGTGISSEILSKIHSRLNAHSDEGHIGLFSCNRRLCLAFGEECALHIESSSGTLISMRFPCISVPDELSHE